MINKMASVKTGAIFVAITNCNNFINKNKRVFCRQTAKHLFYLIGKTACGVLLN